MASTDAEEATIAHFRQTAGAALAAHDRASFELALQTLCGQLSTPMQEVVLGRPQVAGVLQAAAKRHWIEPMESWGAVAKRTKVRFVMPGEKGCKTSFRRWKWDAGSLATATHVAMADSTEVHLAGGSESGSIGSGSSPHSAVHQVSHTSFRHGLDGGDSGGVYSNGSSTEFEAVLLSGMPRLADARPAGAAAAAAFRALAPFLPREERAALRQAFGRLPPVDCLAMVVRVAEMASEGGRREGVGGLPGGGGVWRGGVDEVGGAVAWEGVYRSTGSGLDVNAPSFHMGGDLLGRGDAL